MENLSSGKINDTNDKEKGECKSNDPSPEKKDDIAHVGSSNAFEETEDPESPDPDGITDEKLDEWLDEKKSPKMGNG